MADSKNVQDVFLNHIRKHKISVTIFLVNGVKLTGIVTWFDNFSVLLRRDAHVQLVYKHAISTIMVIPASSSPSSFPVMRLLMPHSIVFLMQRFPCP